MKLITTIILNLFLIFSQTTVTGYKGKLIKLNINATTIDQSEEIDDWHYILETSHSYYNISMKKFSNFFSIGDSIYYLVEKNNTPNYTYNLYSVKSKNYFRLSGPFSSCIIIRYTGKPFIYYDNNSFLYSTQYGEGTLLSNGPLFQTKDPNSCNLLYYIGKWQNKHFIVYAIDEEPYYRFGLVPEINKLHITKDETKEIVVVNNTRITKFYKITDSLYIYNDGLTFIKYAKVKNDTIKSLRYLEYSNNFNGEKWFVKDNYFYYTNYRYPITKDSILLKQPEKLFDCDPESIATDIHNKYLFYITNNKLNIFSVAQNKLYNSIDLGGFEFNFDIFADSQCIFLHRIDESVANENEPPSVPLQLTANVYPNPFNSEFTLDYSMPENSSVLIELYNILGQKVATILNEEKNKGNHSVRYLCKNIAGGVYTVTIKTRNSFIAKKIIYLK